MFKKAQGYILCRRIKNNCNLSLNIWRSHVSNRFIVHYSFLRKNHWSARLSFLAWAWCIKKCIGTLFQEQFRGMIPFLLEKDNTNSKLLPSRSMLVENCFKNSPFIGDIGRHCHLFAILPTPTQWHSEPAQLCGQAWK